MSHRRWEDKIPKHVRLKLWRKRPHICGICGKPIETITDMHVDHIITLKDGGTSDESNLQLAHAACNQAKGGDSNYKYQEPEPTQRHEVHRSIDDVIFMMKAARSFSRKVFANSANGLSIGWYQWMADEFSPRNPGVYMGYKTDELKEYLLESGEVCMYIDKKGLEDFKRYIEPFLDETPQPEGFARPSENDYYFFTQDPILPTHENLGIERVYPIKENGKKRLISYSIAPFKPFNYD